MSDLEQIKLYYTGREDGEGAYSLNGCLGGFKLSRRISGRSFLAETVGGLPNIVIQYISPGTPVGLGYIGAPSADTLAFSTDNVLFGAAVEILEGESKVLLANDAEHYVVVYRENDTALSGSMLLQIIETQDTPIAMGIPPVAATDGGGSIFLAMMIEASEPLTGVTISIPPLVESSETTDDGTLASSGSGTIGTTGSFADWPAFGFAKIMNAAEDTVLERVYYSSRTDTTLAIPEAGRGLLGTSAVAGGATNKAIAIPGFLIAKEEPVNGVIQETADIFTAPTAVTFTDSITTDIDGDMGLWITSEIVDGQIPTAFDRNSLKFAWGTNEKTYTAIRAIGNADYDLYELYVGVNTAPDLTAAPAATSATLPFSYAPSLPGSGTDVFNVVVRKRSAYDLVSLNTYAFPFEVDAQGNQVVPALEPVFDTSLENTASGILLLRAQHSGVNADTWRIYVRSDGTDPDPDIDTPIEEGMLRLWGLSQYIALQTNIGPFDIQSDVRVIVRAYNSETESESENTAVTQLTVTTSVLPPPVNLSAGAESSTGHANISSGFDAISIVSDTPSVVFRLFEGETRLIAGGSLVIRSSTDAISTGWDFVQETISGTGVAEPLEVVDANTIYICVNGQRVAKLEVDNSIIKANGFNFWDDTIVQVDSGSPALSLTDRVTFQELSADTGEWRTWMEVDDAGILSTYRRLVQNG